jgi:predicted amidophosphoribosyltransferase
VAKALGVELRVQGLRRVRNTPRQVDLPHRERQRNIAGAFAAGKLGNARRVLLIDDVRTTGATLRAATQALQAGGVAEVRSLVLATRLLGQST